MGKSQLKTRMEILNQIDKNIYLFSIKKYTNSCYQEKK